MKQQIMLFEPVSFKFQNLKKNLKLNQNKNFFFKKHNLLNF